MTGTAAGASLGPGAGSVVIHQRTAAVTIDVTPNSSGRWNVITVTPTFHGGAVRGGRVHLSFTMLDMSMGTQRFGLKQVHAGVYRYNGPGFVMPGIWRLQVEVRTRAGRRFEADVRDVVHG